MSKIPSSRPPSRYETAKKLTPLMPAELISEIKSPSRMKFEKQRNGQFILAQYIKRKEDKPEQQELNAIDKILSKSTKCLSKPASKKPPLPKSSRGTRTNKGSMFCTDMWPDSHFKQFIKESDTKVSRDSNETFIKERTRPVDHYRRDLDRMFLQKHPEWALGNEICRNYLEASEGEGVKESRNQSTCASIINSFIRKQNHKAQSQTLVTDEQYEPVRITRPSLPKLANKSENRLDSNPKFEQPKEEECNRSFECSIADELEDRDEEEEYLTVKTKGNSVSSLRFHLDFNSIFNPETSNRAQSRSVFGSRPLSLREELDQFEPSSVRGAKDERSLLERNIRDPFKIQKVVFVNRKGVKRNLQYWQPKTHMRKTFHGNYEGGTMRAALITRGRDKRHEYGSFA